jgi:hypothetical protein
MRRLLALGVCVAALLSGCGGDGDSDSTDTAAGETGATTTVPERSPESVGGQDEGKEKASPAAKGAEQDSGSSQSPQSTKMVRVPPISSAPTEGSEAPAPGVETVKGGDNSVQTYGTEASEEERTEAAIALQAFLNARLQGDWEGICEALAQPALAQLDKFIKRAQSEGKDVGCAGALAILDQGTAQSQLRQEAEITEVLSFRGGGHIPSDPSYLIFIGPPGKTLYSMPMYLEGGTWKVGMALPSPLPV